MGRSWRKWEAAAEDGTLRLSGARAGTASNQIGVAHDSVVVLVTRGARLHTNLTLSIREQRCIYWQTLPLQD